MKWLPAFAIVTAFQLLATLPGAAQGTDNAVVRLAFGTSNYVSLPIFLAIDRHMFDQEHVKVTPMTFVGSATVQLPCMVHGGVDIIASAPAPGVFNQELQGFDF